jgi:hypothetical protein
MSDVMNAIPRVVHPDDVECRAIHVACRDLRFVLRRKFYIHKDKARKSLHVS